MSNTKYIAIEVMDGKPLVTKESVVDAIDEAIKRVLVEEEGCDPLYASRVSYNVASTIEKDFELYEEIFGNYLRSK